MRCYICDKELKPHEVKVHPKTLKIEPCFTCRGKSAELNGQQEWDKKGILKQTK